MQQRTLHQHELAELDLEPEVLETQFTALFLKRSSAPLLFEKAIDQAKKEEGKEEDQHERGEEGSNEGGLTEEDQQLFETIVMGLTTDELKTWTEKIAKEKS